MKKTGVLLFAMLLAATVFATAPAAIDKKLCSCPKQLANGKCVVDSLSKIKPASPVKKADAQAKKTCKTESKSIFSSLFSVEFPTSAIEEFFLSAQKVLIEKFS
ncbi:hypothetical protein KXQ82_00925 [Mucilaginibacter sp. HMF5004]|uniref:hypothetical protein n=1 Tax=Mucilaginibacter rivuli TaxID=2857527 RepID=UPI001C6021A8|nr:hypothetical protein [Mucilaginibacter rivuli]MBW4888251.1 hypothetical protein [Mucilaginibacter rivuli]